MDRADAPGSSLQAGVTDGAKPPVRPCVPLNQAVQCLECFGTHPRRESLSKTLPGFVFFPDSPFIKEPTTYRPRGEFHHGSVPEFNPATGVWKVQLQSDVEGVWLYASEDGSWVGARNNHPPDPMMPLPVKRRFQRKEGL